MRKPPDYRGNRKFFQEENIPGNYFYILQFNDIRKGLDFFKKYVKNQEE